MAGLTGCSKNPFVPAIPYVEQPDAATIGVPRYYATAVTLDGYAQPVLATTYDGRPTKLDGLPGHPATQGRSDAFMQAAVLQLYDPDRAQHPSRSHEPISWNKVLSDIEELRDGWSRSRGQGVRLLLGHTTSPTLQRQLTAFLSDFPQARIHLHEPAGVFDRRQLAAIAYGEPLDLHYRLEECSAVVSLDDDLLGPGPLQVRNALGWAKARHSGRPGIRLYCAESVPGATGAMAALRMATNASRMPAVADALAAALGLPAPNIELTPNERAWVARAADALRRAEGHALVSSGLSAGPQTAVRVAQINQAIGAAGRTLSFVKPFDGMTDAGSLTELVADMNAGAVQTLIIIDANPVYSAPGTLDFKSALSKVHKSIHLGAQRDETGDLCTYQLSTTHSLESWSDARAVDGTATIIQPVITQFYDVRTVHQIMAMLSGQGDVAADIPVKDTWQSVFGQSFDEKWKRALHDGFTGSASSPVDVQPVAAAIPSLPTGGDLDVVFRLDPSAWDGRFANVAWLQELPKPLTTLTWDNAISISPALARRQTIKNGDIVEVTIAGRTVGGPAWIVPGQAAETIALGLGYGRWRAGRVGDNVGYDGYSVRPPEQPWLTKGTLRKTGDHVQLAVTQLHHRLEGFDFVRETASGQASTEAPAPPQPSLYPPQPGARHAWGMVIDLDSCIGCNACVAACTAENNVPVVGKDQIKLGREMHWLRIARYYSGDVETPRSSFQPVPCMHCEEAPCEMGCPVGATTHSPEGVNQMVYNRCIGTRTCSSYCPYKVRRFNFFDYRSAREAPEQAAHNPDVTLRSRGVMEKCTYCTQRIEAAHAAADKERRDLREGDVVTACQSACPTHAIVFGDINDPNSDVSKLRRDGRHYTLLEELGTRPRTTYLARWNDTPDDEGHT
ncbi:4Fe-4S dicluster domain-containing protein [Afipia sp. TerB]